MIEFLVRLHSEDSAAAAKAQPSPYSGEKMPYYMQWDQRWAYDSYSGGRFGQTGCGPTVMAMIYAGVKGDKDMTPDKMAEFSREHGYSTDGNGTLWTLMSDGASELGLNYEVLPLVKSRIDDALQAGQPVILILGPGDFTSGGHYIVLREYTHDGYKIYDPFSLSNTRKLWTYEQLEGQIRNIWTYWA